jgi:hypothetical protein
MSTSLPFGEAKTLQHFMAHLSELPPWSWLYIGSNVSKVTLDTICHPKAMDAKEMSEAESLEFEAYVKSTGLQCFLCRDDLEDIEDNLSQQVTDFTQHELANAINFYWENDAFVNL